MIAPRPGDVGRPFPCGRRPPLPKKSRALRIVALGHELEQIELSRLAVLVVAAIAASSREYFGFINQSLSKFRVKSRVLLYEAHDRSRIARAGRRRTRPC